MISSLDLTLLEKLRHHASGKVTARCPACARAGGDRSGQHLVIFPDGRFACAAAPGDAAHRRDIHALTGLPPERKPDAGPWMPTGPSALQRREWQVKVEAERQRQRAAQDLAAAARQARDTILRHWAWEPAEVWQDSPQTPDSHCVTHHPGHFLASLFSPQDLLWTGPVHASGGPAWQDHWRTCAEWRTLRRDATLGPMTTPATWQPGSLSRSATQVRGVPYVVLDFDGLDGVKPHDRSSLSAHLHASLALIRWLREHLGWRLAAILWTGGKSLHAWFHTPPPQELAALLPLASAFGIDAGLLDRPEHPCRLPGQRHAATGKRSSVLWLQHGAGG